MARASYLLFGVVACASLLRDLPLRDRLRRQLPVIPYAVDRGPEAALPIAIADVSAWGHFLLAAGKRVPRLRGRPGSTPPA